MVLPISVADMNAVDQSMKNIWGKTEGTVVVDRWKTEAMRWKSNEKKRGQWRNSKRERTRAGKDIERCSYICFIRICSSR